jgi:hypothetical protein
MIVLLANEMRPERPFQLELYDNHGINFKPSR